MKWRIASTFLIFLLSVNLAHSQDSWTNDINWASRNTGVPDCYGNYVAQGLTQCVANPAALAAQTGNDPPRWTGNRSCAIAQAILAANSGQCQRAFDIAILTQCHNGNGQQRIAAAGVQAVCATIKAIPFP